MTSENDEEVRIYILKPHLVKEFRKSRFHKSQRAPELSSLAGSSQTPRHRRAQAIFSYVKGVHVHAP